MIACRVSENDDIALSAAPYVPCIDTDGNCVRCERGTCKVNISIKLCFVCLWALALAQNEVYIKTISK